MNARQMGFGIVIGSALALGIATPTSAGLFGLPKFKVEQSDDRFSTNGTTTYTGLWNRISKKSVAGGIHIDDKGVFVDPVIVRGRKDGAIVALFFAVHNEADRDSAGMGDMLLLGSLQRIVFVTGEGDPIGLNIEKSSEDTTGPSTWNSISRMASINVRESGIASVTPDQFVRIANAPNLIARVEGSRRSVTYEAKDISKDFRKNLQTFWAGYSGSTR